MTFASMADKFAEKNCALLGLSVDSNPSHIDWSRSMEKYQWKNIKNPKISFPIVADDLGTVAKMYGMLMPASSATRTVRTVFFIDPEGTIRAMLLYPLTTGRNMDEIMRLLLALQAYDKTGYATPADWMPGDPQVMPVPQTMPAAGERLNDEKKGAVSCLDWYICFTGETKQPAMQKPVSMNREQKTGEVPAAAMQNAGMSEIIDMMGGISKQANKTQINKNTVSGNATFTDSKTVQNPAQPFVRGTNPLHNPIGGIMEQNRLLFDTDNGFGLKNEYFIKRDYPNMGL